MDNKNRPRSREKNVTGAGKGVHREGGGLGTGPVGGSGSNIFGHDSGSSVRPGSVRPTHRPGAGHEQRSGGGYARSGGRSVRRGGRSSLLTLIIIAVLLFLLLRSCGSGSLLDSLDTGGTSSYGSGSSDYGSLLPGVSSQSSGSSSQTSGFSGWSTGTTGWTGSSNTGKLDRSVDPAAREKFTRIVGDGKDQVTVMVYLCGSDLEARSAMASRDLVEMANAALSDSVNLIVYTGGTTNWQIKGVNISTNYNQIYQVTRGGMTCLKSRAGTGSMTDPATLLSFLEFCRDNYPADRYELILWDHGGGSLSGYGYDLKYPNSGSMSLSALESALKSSGMSFDFVGFDACLMATVETAAMLSRYADYLIASEETEPGIGWYYTNWLTKLSADPSMPTLDVGRQIVDDFVDKCAQDCAGQPTTLSVIDLAELSATLPDDFSAFSQSLKSLITDGDYKTVSTARSESREFAASTVIDQIDFVDFAQRLGTDEGKELAKVLLSAVKYNRTSSRMTNAYGLSVYFPLRKLSKVSTAVKTYDALGMDEDFTDCIREFASMETGGQVVSHASGYTLDPYSALFGSAPSSPVSTPQSPADIADLLSLFLGGGTSYGLDSSCFTGRALNDVESMAVYLADNRFDGSALVWQRSAEGGYSLSLPESQWALVEDLDLSLYYDDGEGYVELGLDNIFDFNDRGELVPDTSGTWISVNDQPVAYFHTETEDDGEHYVIRGRIPALLTRAGAKNAELVDLIAVFDDENPKGYIAGAQPVYGADETETVSRGLIELEDGMTLQFICDYYSYEGEYQDSYRLGQPITVNGALRLSDTDLGGGGKALLFYRFADIYGQHYWTDALLIG